MLHQVPAHLPKLCSLEQPTAFMFATIQDSVEDTKGNNGDFGELTMTNLRVTWVSKQQRRTNISLGLNCITSVTVKMVASRLRGEI